MSGWPASGPNPVTMLSTPGGQAGLVRDRAKLECRERRQLRGLEHHGAAGRERGGDLPGGHQQRIVPGDDGAGDAERLPDRSGREAGIGERNGLFLLRVQLLGQAGIEVEAAGGVGDIPLGLGQRLAVVEHLQARQLAPGARGSRRRWRADSARARRLRSRGHGPSSKARRAALTAASTSSAVPEGA